MKNNIEVSSVVRTKIGVAVFVSSWDDGGVWLNLQGRDGGVHVVLTSKEAQRLLDGLQDILTEAGKGETL